MNKKDSCFYILKGTDEDGLPVYKYGATKASLKNRVRHAEHIYGKASLVKPNFKCIVKFNSKTPFSIENHFRFSVIASCDSNTDIPNKHAGEFFKSDDIGMTIVFFEEKLTCYKFKGIHKKAYKRYLYTKEVVYG
jgi:hypothetical protein